MKIVSRNISEIMLLEQLLQKMITRLADTAKIAIRNYMITLLANRV